MKICLITHSSGVTHGGTRSLLELIDFLLTKKHINIKVILPFKGPLELELKKRNIEYKVINMSWWAHSQNSPPDASSLDLITEGKKIAEVLKKWEIDVVYTNTSVIASGAFASIINRNPHVWHVREFGELHDNSEYMLEINERSNFINACSNTVIFNSNALRDYYMKNVDNPKSKVIYNYVSTRIQRLNKVESGNKVDIVVPFYNDPWILKCLQSIKDNKSNSLNKVYILDDVSPDKELAKKVKKFAKQNTETFIYTRNKENKGFVNNINKGAKLSDNDVIFLNTDTLVTKNWVEKLKDIAYQSDKIATVTPLSNNASIYSITDILKENAEREVKKVNQILERVSPLEYTTCPTAHGFCMYVKREAFNDIGYFDYKTFGMGNGEENDFSLRAINKGWKNVLSCKTFVYHVGNQSFKDKKDELLHKNSKIIHERYPDYKKTLINFDEERKPLKDIKHLVKYLRNNEQILEEPAFTIVGRVTRSKGQIDAIKSSKKLLDKGIKIHLLIVGTFAEGTDDSKEILAYIDKHDLHRNVHILNALDNPFSMIQISRALLMCSKNEAFGRVTAEAMMAKRPVIGTNSGGTPELIDAPDNGYLFETGDVEQLASKMEELLKKNDDDYKSMCESAYKAITEKISQEKYGGEIYKEFARCKSEDNPLKDLGAFFSILGKQTKTLKLKNDDLSYRVNNPSLEIRLLRKIKSKCRAVAIKLKIYGILKTSLKVLRRALLLILRTYQRLRHFVRSRI
jgi:glycosyltransferase involved in cell wall biosynthesis